MSFLYNSNAICDSTCFSDASFIGSDDTRSQYIHQSCSHDTMSSARSSSVAIKKPEIDKHYLFPTLPAPINYTTLTQQERFHSYIQVEIPKASFLTKPTSNNSTTHEPLRKAVSNIEAINALIEKNGLPSPNPLSWVTRIIFPDSKLPKPFVDEDVRASDYWIQDPDSEGFIAHPTEVSEAGIKTWLNYLIGVLGIIHGVIPSDAKTGKRIVVDGCEDRSFDHNTHNKGPSGGLNYRKPDLVLLNRDIRHSLSSTTRLQWPLVQAIGEVSVTQSAKNRLIRQIMSNATNMFEAQPFRKFVLGLGFHGDGDKLQFFVVLVDRAGVQYTDSHRIAGFNGLDFGRILFGLAYAHPEVIGVDTKMTIDRLSGKVTSIIVDNQAFDIIVQIHSSPILFGRGTRVFIVRDANGALHILKDSWILASHTTSEITHLKTIQQAIKDCDNARLQHLHPRIIAGEDLIDDTNTVRNASSQRPPIRIRRRIVTGPIGEPITSFRSRREFIQVMLDTVNCWFVITAP
jgi:hypothetical protein